MKLNIRFDLDGCLVDFETHLANVLRSSYGAIIQPSDDFDIQTEPSVTRRQLFEAFRTVYREADMTPIYDGATDLLQRLHGMSQQPVHIVTARPVDCAHHTHRLVKRVARHVPFTISFANPPFSKLDFLNGTEFFVEDRKSTAAQIALTGRKVFLPSRPWNETLTHDNIIRIAGVHELLPHVDWFVTDATQAAA